MADLGIALAVSGGAALALLLAAWILSIPMRDVSIVDVAWGLAFVDIAWVSAWLADGDGGRSALAVGLVTVWGLRLALHIGYRKVKHPGEDPRYTKMRERADGRGRSFVLRSLFMVFLLQAVLAWFVSLPLQGAAASTNDGLGPLAFIGVAVWLVGFVFEAGGDLQLQRFKADPANKGKVMDQGFWRYTRHPNYFGDFAVWWGIYLVALDGGAWWAFPGPVLMTVLLTRVSGKDLLEKSMSSRPGYKEYVERTSGFIPLPPRGNG